MTSAQENSGEREKRGGKEKGRFVDRNLILYFRFVSY